MLLLLPWEAPIGEIAQCLFLPLHDLERGKDIAEKAGSQFKDTRQDVETQIRDNPLAAVGIAFGAGLIIAMLRGK